MFQHQRDCNNSCPVSSHVDPIGTGLHTYPSNFFPAIANEQIFNCTTAMDVFPPNKRLSSFVFKMLQCPVNTRCPIGQVDVETARSAMLAWNYSHSLCKMKDAINKRDPVKVLVFGGSVTAGMSSWGCCCDRNFDSKCPKAEDLWPAAGQAPTHQHDSRNHPESYCNFDGQDNNPKGATACDWTGRLHRWFKTRGMDSVSVANEAIGGTTSRSR